MRDLEGGLKPTKSALEQLQSIGSKFGPQALLISKSLSIIKSGFLQMAEQTQVWGDKWQMTVTKVQAGWNQFIANLFQGKDVVKASVNDAIKAAADAQLLLDELFKRENSLKIQSVQTQAEINQLMATVKDASKSDSERLQAIEQILKKETDLAKVKRDIAQQELEAYQGPLMERTQLSAEELKTVIDNYNANRDKFKLAEEYIALLEREKKLTLPVNHPFWEKHRPGDRWNCKCTLQQTDDPVNDEVIRDFYPVPQQPGLDNNPADDGKLFSDSHP